MLHMGLGPLVLSATTSPYVTYAVCCNAFSLESIFNLHHAELNETIGLAQDKQFRQQSTACQWLPVFIKNNIEVLRERILSAQNMVKP